MAAEAHHFTVPRTARYWTAGPPPTEALGTLYVLHGYGQLAQFFVRKFQAAADSGWHVVAPEGGHRFYLKGTSGRVGASWMTREDRLSDIDDYVAFLDALRTQLTTTSPKGTRSCSVFLKAWLRPCVGWPSVKGHPSLGMVSSPTAESSLRTCPKTSKLCPSPHPSPHRRRGGPLRFGCRIGVSILEARVAGC